MAEPFDRASVKVVPGGAQGVAPLPHLSVRERFAKSLRCKVCNMITPIADFNPQTNTCLACEGLAGEKAEKQGLPAGMTVQTTVTMPSGASNSQIDQILKAFQAIGAPDTQKALEMERESLNKRLKDVDSLIGRLKLITGTKRKYTRKVRVSK